MKPPGHRVHNYEVDAFIGRGYLVTVHANGAQAIDTAHSRWQRTPLPHVSAAMLFYLVLDSIIDGYFPVLDALGEQIDALDQQVFTRVDRAVLRQIFALRRSLLFIRKQLGPIRDALNELLRVEAEPIFTLARAREYFTDVYDHVLRLTDFVDTYRDMVGSSMEAYQSSLSNQLNTNMQRLTVIATVLATWSVVTSFYGMNLFGLGINSTSPYAVPLVFGGLVIVSIIELIIFARKGWL
jgi:magnesium transporter